MTEGIHTEREEERRRRIARGLHRFHERRKAAAKLRPRDLARLEHDPNVAPTLRPLLRIAEEEALELLNALGGIDAVTPQRRMLIEDVAAVGIALRGTLSLYLQTGDGEVAARIGTLTGARRQSLVTLGLERFEKQIDGGIDVYRAAVAAQRVAEAAARNAKASTPEPHGGPGIDLAPGANLARRDEEKPT